MFGFIVQVLCFKYPSQEIGALLVSLVEFLLYNLFLISVEIFVCIVSIITVVFFSKFIHLKNL